MGATADVEQGLKDLKPGKNETLEEFAKRGLLWQNEIYSANAGTDLGIDWEKISADDRAKWLKWATQKFRDARAAKRPRTLNHTIELSQFDKLAPPNVEIIFRLLAPSGGRNIPITIFEHTDMQTVQLESDRLSALKQRHLYKTEWRDRKTKKWLNKKPTLYADSKREFLVSVPWKGTASDAVVKQAIKVGTDSLGVRVKITKYVDPIQREAEPHPQRELDLGQLSPVIEPPPDRVPMPQNEEQAAGMVLLGMEWLRQHAPQRLTEQGLAALPVKGNAAIIGVAKPGSNERP
jgi:hypothetical protein